VVSCRRDLPQRERDRKRVRERCAIGGEVGNQRRPHREGHQEDFVILVRSLYEAIDPAGKASIIKFGHSRYVKYHGSEQGWDDLLAQTKTTPLPAAGFTIAQYVPPTPQQQAADLVKTKKPEEMSFAEWELVLSVGTQEDQDKVWNSLKGKNLQMAEVQVISASPTKLELAASVDDIDQKRADIELAVDETQLIDVSSGECRRGEKNRSDQLAKHCVSS